ncbi:MAG: pyridoxal phosphate-dependent aminotransferase [Thermoflexales bacterium]|nr:pyridoxal phosphate-dependent aminotransferase [Thermoflexales bacterium]MDW8350966.1 pyridoxal phosphate-dependent aminotransferase [Anaerolineae bacterium]
MTTNGTQTQTKPLQRVSARTAAVQPSATMAVEGRVKQMRAAGEPVIGFGAGEPDFPTPELIKQAAIKAIHDNFTRYTETGGMAALKEAIAARERANTGLDYKASQVATHTGGKESLYLAFQALCEAGDEVLIPAPYWVSYVEQVRLAEATPVIVPTTVRDRFKVTGELLARYTTPRTRILVLNSPSNPTGMVYSESELEDIAAWARTNDVIILSDELYDRIVFNPPYARWLRVAPDLYDRTVVINGLSKAYAMTGWRLGYAVGPEWIIKAMLKIQSHSNSHPTSITQAAALAAYTNDLEAEIAAMVAAFKERRDWIVAALNEIPGVNCIMPEGAFYVFPDFTGVLGRPLKYGRVCDSSEALAIYLLDSVKVGIVHGEAFGAPGCARLSYAMELDKIKAGIERMKDALTFA